MAIFGFKENIGSVIQKLKQRQYKNTSEKMELIEQLREMSPGTKDVIWMVAEADQYLRDFAVEVIRRDPGNKLLDLLVKEMESKSETAQKQIAGVIAQCEPFGLNSYLKKSISSQQEKDRKLCMQILTKLRGIDRYIDIYHEAIKDPLEDIRFLAVERLSSYITSLGIFLLLRPMLNDESERIRHHIIMRMAKLNTHRIIEPFFERLPLEPPQIQKRIMETLAKIAQTQDEGLEKYIIPALANENELARRTSAQLLIRMNNKKQIIREFLVYTRGVAHWLRDRAYKTFNEITHAIIDDILELLNDPDDAIRIESLLLAANIQDQRIIPGVVHILNSDLDWWIKHCAIDVLVQFKSPEIASTLHNLLDDPDLTCSVLGAYGEIAEKSAIPVLQQALYRKSMYMRVVAARALAKYNLPETQAILNQCLSTTDDWILRNEIAKLLDKEVQELDRGPKKLDKEQVMRELKEMGIEMEDEQITANPIQEEGEDIVLATFSGSFDRDIVPPSSKQKFLDEVQKSQSSSTVIEKKDSLRELAEQHQGNTSQTGFPKRPAGIYPSQPSQNSSNVLRPTAPRPQVNPAMLNPQTGNPQVGNPHQMGNPQVGNPHQMGNPQVGNPHQMGNPQVGNPQTGGNRTTGNFPTISDMKKNPFPGIKRTTSAFKIPPKSPEEE